MKKHLNVRQTARALHMRISSIGLVSPQLRFHYLRGINFGFLQPLANRKKGISLD